MDTLVFAPMYFYCFKGNVGTMAVAHKCPNRQRANRWHFVPYIMQFQNTIRFKIPHGGKGSMASQSSSKGNKTKQIKFLIASHIRG